MEARDYRRKIHFKKNLSMYFDFLKKYKWGVFFLLFAVTVAQATLLVDKLLFKKLIDSAESYGSQTLLRSGFVDVLVVLVIIFTVNTVFKVVSKWYRITLLNVIESKMILDLKKKFFNHILHLSYSFHTTHKTGSLISRLLRGGNAIETMTDVIVFSIAPLILQLIAVSGSLFVFDWIPAVIVLITAVLFIGYSFIIQQFQQEAHIIVNEREDTEKANVSDFFTNIDSIKYFGKEYKIKNRFASLAEKTRKAQVTNWNYFRAMDSGQAFILAVGTLGLLYFSTKQFLAGSMSLGTLAFVYTVYGNLMNPLFSFVHGMRGFYRSMADFQALFEYMDYSNEIKDKPHAKTLKIRKGSIEFANVEFHYSKKKRVFKDFSLSIHPNEKIALVGPSGCGKSTLIRLLYRLFDPQDGAIYIDGKNINEFKQESLRSELSIVPQECVLFDDTIYNNIAFSRPGATKKEVLQAIHFSQLSRIIRDFSEGANTIVGERGVRLSGGEKQRVSIARAILANRKVLILDEATSSLDSETEHEIQQDLDRLMNGRTSIIIAHRLSTIMKADKIVVMENGRITQIGTHNQLIKNSGKYKKLWNIQKGGYLE